MNPVTSSTLQLPARFAPPAATTATVSAAAAATAATEVAAAYRLRPSLIDDEGTTIELVLVQFVDRFLSVLVCCHFHECEPTCAPSRLIAHDANVVYGASAAEQLGEFFVRALIGEVANVQSAAHRCETLSRAC
jgi:hypothetical protein